MNISIREAERSDANRIFLVQKKVWIDTYPNDKLRIKRNDIAKKFENKEKRIGKIEESIESTEHKWWVAENIGEIIGFCGANIKNKKQNINAIYVLTKYQRRGIGGRLIKKAFAWLDYKKDIFIKLASYNKQACDFYIKYGFVKVEDEICEPLKLASEKEIPVIKMLKKANNS